MSGHYYLEFELVSKFQRWSYTSTPEQDLDFWAALQFGIPHLLCQLFYLLPKSLSELPSNEYLILSLFSSQTETCWEAWIVYSKVVAFAVCCFSGTIKEGFSLFSVRSWFFNYFFFQFLCLTSFIQINTIIIGKLFLPVFFKSWLESVGFQAYGWLSLCLQAGCWDLSPRREVANLTGLWHRGGGPVTACVDASVIQRVGWRGAGKNI